MGFKEGGLRGSLRNVSVGAGVIPDSVDNRWPMTEGSGTALGNSIGSVGATLTGAGWVSDSRYNGGYATDYDGANDFGQTDSAIDINGQEFTVMGWFNFDAINSFERVFKSGSNPDGTVDDGWNLRFAGSELTIEHRNGGTNNNLSLSTISLSTGVDYFLGVATAGNSATLYIYDGSQQLDSASGSGARGQTGGEVLTWMAGDGGYVDGQVDDVTVATGSQLSQSDIEFVWSNTGPNA